MAKQSKSRSRWNSSLSKFKGLLIQYFFEFVILVLGITVSFWLNERSIQNIEKQETIKVLENIGMEVQDLKKYCRERSDTWEQDIQLYSTLLEDSLDVERIKELTTSKSRIEYNLIYYRAFEPPMNRYLSIINSGDIKLIKSDKLKEVLSRLHTYNFSSIETTVQYEKSIKGQLVQLLTSKHPSLLLAVDDSSVSLDKFSVMLHNAILQNPELRSKLRVQMKYFETRMSLLRLYVFALDELESELSRAQQEI